MLKLSGQHPQMFNSISNILDSSNTSLKLFLQDGLGLCTDEEKRSFDSEQELFYGFLKDSIQAVNLKRPKTILGLYLLSADESQLDTINNIFGPKGGSDLPIGTTVSPETFDSFLESKSNNTKMLLFLQRMDFISVFLFPSLAIDPKDSAKKLLLDCSLLVKSASVLNIYAEIVCKVYYPTYFSIHISNFNFSIGLLNFKEFWCTIVNEVSTNHKMPRIVMVSAFELDHEIPDQRISINNGWWRRTHKTSYEPNAFVENIEEIPYEQSKLDTCRKTCESCFTSDDCCVGPCEYPNSSRFHVFRNQSKVCRYKDALCDEDIPLTPTNWNNNSIPEDFAGQNNHSYPEFVYILLFTLLGLTFIIVFSGFFIKIYLVRQL